MQYRKHGGPGSNPKLHAGRVRRNQESWVVDKLKSRKRKVRAAVGLTILTVLTVAVAGVYLYGLHPWSRVNHVSLRTIVFEVNGELRSVGPDEVLEVMTSDTIRLQKINTSVMFDWGLDFRSEGIYRDALLNGTRVDEALGHQPDVLDTPKTIQILYRGEPVGEARLQVQASPNYWAARALIVEDPARKAEFLEKELVLSPESTDIRTQLAEVYDQMGLADKAIREYELVYAASPDTLWLIKLERLYRQEGRIRDLAGVYDRLISKDPSVEHVILAAQTYEKTGDMDRTMSYYERVVGDLKGIERAAVLKKVGYLYFVKGELTRAVKAFEEAGRLDESDPNVHFNLGELYQRLGETDKSIESLEKAVSLQPDDLDSVLLLVAQLEKKKDYARLLPYLERMSKENPKDLSRQVSLARAYEHENRLQELMGVYSAIVKLDPMNKEPLLKLGSLHFQRRDFIKSENAFKRVLALDPEDAEAYRYLFRIYRLTGRTDQAVEAAERQLENDPGDSSLYEYLYAQLRDRKGEDLKVFLQEGVQALPAEPKLREYLGTVYLREQNLPFALEQFEAAQKLKSGDLSILYQLAKLYEALGLPEEALEHYERVIQIDEGYRDAGDSFARLRLAQIRDGQQ